MSEIFIKTLGSEAVLWMWGRVPSIYIGDRSCEIDPFPAYPHDERTFASTLSLLEAFWPAKFKLLAWLLPYELRSGTNGHSDRSFPWSPRSEDRQPPTHHIVAAGKRIPIHPAVTRYLAAHEYGHHVEWWLAEPSEQYPFGGGENDYKVLEEYAQVRDGKFHRTYGSGGIWHTSLTEIFACDFRLFAGVEPEFWPHPGIPRLEECPAAIDWWNRKRDLWLRRA